MRRCQDYLGTVTDLSVLYSLTDDELLNLHFNADHIEAINYLIENRFQAPPTFAAQDQRISAFVQQAIILHSDALQRIVNELDEKIKENESTLSECMVKFWQRLIEQRGDEGAKIYVVKHLYAGKELTINELKTLKDGYSAAKRLAV